MEGLNNDEVVKDSSGSVKERRHQYPAPGKRQEIKERRRRWKGEKKREGEGAYSLTSKVPTLKKL